MRILRSQIDLDDFNPRTITDENRKRLKQSIADFGFLGAPIFNRRTGHVVGGHQRVSVLDSMMHGAEYELDVIEIDIPEKDEARLNVVLNNPDVQGAYNFGAIDQICKEFGLDPGKDCLFSPEMVSVEFPDFADAFENFGSVPKKEVSEEEKELYRKERERMRSRMKANQDEIGGYNMESKGVLSVVFKGVSDMKAFLASKGIDESKTVVAASDIF